MNKIKTSCNSVDDFKRLAESELEPAVRDFYFNGAGRQYTLRENEAAFARIKLRGRALVDVSDRSAISTIMGQESIAPMFIAPMAFHKLASVEAELGSAKAAERAGVGMMMSALSTSRFEDVSGLSPRKPWLQIYIYKNREITKNIIRLAEESNYHALVLTVDTPVYDRRYTQHGDLVLPKDMTLENLSRCGLDLSNIDPERRASYLSAQLDDSVTWDDLEWLRSISDLPIFLKGITNKVDAKVAVDAGVSGIMVSNHGGRQLDSLPATIDVLSEIRSTVGSDLLVFIDGGIRTGGDVFKCLAYGANAVLIGRPILWGLAARGSQGVFEVLECIKEELDTTMALTGCSRLSDISLDCIY
jgi:isopentenyl diphosphate isomerase/L-lactate dehydrogenase-like FMN-dependent dehydrogenase